jgi:hypothetical protein
MLTRPGMLRLLLGSSTAVDLDTEEGRAFLQERLAFYNEVCLLISGSFLLVGGALLLVGQPAPEPVTHDQERRGVERDRLAVALHASTLLVQLVAWLVCARGPRLSATWLRAIDAGALFLVCVGFCRQFLSADASRFEQMGPFPRVTPVLILTHALVARAVFVPSPALWTAAVSVVAALPVVAAAGFAPTPCRRRSGWAALFPRRSKA